MSQQNHRQEVQEAIRASLPEFCERNDISFEPETLDKLAAWVTVAMPPRMVRVGCGPIEGEVEFACSCTGQCQRWVRVEDWESRPGYTSLRIKRRDDAGEECLTGNDYRFLLDGHDITDGLMSLKLEIGAGIANTCAIKFMPDAVDVDADALTALTTVVESGQAKSDTVHIPHLLSPLVGCSNSEIRRLLSQGGIKRNGEVIEDADLPWSEVEGAEFQIGKRHSYVIDGYSLFVKVDGTHRGDVVIWARESLPLAHGHIDEIDLAGNKNLIKFRLSEGLKDMLRQELEALDGVEEIEIRPGHVALIRPEPREEL